MPCASSACKNLSGGAKAKHLGQNCFWWKNLKWFKNAWLKFQRGRKAHSNTPFSFQRPCLQSWFFQFNTQWKTTLVFWLYVFLQNELFSKTQQMISPYSIYSMEEGSIFRVKPQKKRHQENCSPTWLTYTVEADSSLNYLQCWGRFFRYGIFLQENKTCA